MNKIWDRLAIVIAIILLATAILKLIGLYAIFDLFHEAVQDIPETNLFQVWMNVVIREHSSIIKVLLTLLGCVLMLLKKSSGWIITSSIFGSLLIIMTKNLFCYPETYMEISDFGSIVLLVTFIIAVSGCFVILLTSEIRRKYNIEWKHLGVAALLLSILLFDGYLFST